MRKTLRWIPSSVCFEGQHELVAHFAEWGVGGLGGRGGLRGGGGGESLALHQPQLTADREMGGKYAAGAFQL